MRMSENEALAVAHEHRPEGWEIRVWNNLGWHVSWTPCANHPVTVYYDEMREKGQPLRFWAMLARDPDRHPGTGIPDIDGEGKTVMKAAKRIVKCYRKHVARINTNLERAEKL